MSLLAASALGSMQFPARNESVKAKWCPVYIEPMLGSGERLCIAVTVINPSAHLVVPVVALNRLDCLYGSESAAILMAADIVIADLKSAIARHGEESFKMWKSPVEGVELGVVRDGAADSMEAIARAALMMSASLVERICEVDEDSAVPNERLSGNRLEELIKEGTTKLNPGLAVMFGRQRRQAANARPVTIGFVGNVIVANFGLLTPQYLSANVRDIKSKLWDLANVRDDLKNNKLIPSKVSRFEMLFYRPSDEAPEYSTRQITNLNEAVNELDAEADSKDIRCRANYNYETIVNTLVEAEAA